jgi:hypothetical protein
MRGCNTWILNYDVFHQLMCFFVGLPRRNIETVETFTSDVWSVVCRRQDNFHTVLYCYIAFYLCSTRFCRTVEGGIVVG